MSNPDQERVVSITLNEKGLPVPSQDPIEVKQHQQKIKWCAAFDFKIEIDGYSEPNYGKGASEGCAFSAKTENFTAPIGTSYKYSIIANGQTNDPEIIVKP